jgi:hypothetical protein
VPRTRARRRARAGAPRALRPGQKGALTTVCAFCRALFFIFSPSQLFQFFVREEAALKAELATIAAFEATLNAAKKTAKKAAAKAAQHAAQPQQQAGAPTAQAPPPARVPTAQRSRRARPARTAPVPAAVPPDDSGGGDGDAAAMDETDDAAAPAAAAVVVNAADFGSGDATDDDADEGDRESDLGDASSDAEEEVEEEADDVALPRAADDDDDDGRGASSDALAKPPLLFYDPRRCAAFAAEGRLCFDAARDAVRDAAVLRELWALRTRYLPLWCHLSAAGESPDDVLSEPGVDAALAADMAALWRQRAALPCALRAAGVAARRAGGAGLAFALAGEHIGSDFSVSYLDSCRGALTPPGGAPVRRETRAALHRAALLAFLATAAAEGARTVTIVSCAAEWLFDSDTGRMSLQEYAIVRPPSGGAEEVEVTRPVTIPAGASAERAAALGAKAAAKQRRADDEALREAFYPEMLAAGVGAGVVTRWSRLKGGSAEVVPIFPGCLFAKTCLRLAGAKRYASHAALQAAALRAMERHGGAVFLAHLAPPDAEARARAEFARKCLGHVLAPPLARGDQDATQTYAPPPGAHTTAALMDGFLAMQRRAYGMDDDARVAVTA